MRPPKFKLFMMILVLLTLSSQHVGAQTTPPSELREVIWEGVVIRFPAKSYVFNVEQPKKANVRTAARLLESPSPCTPTMADCRPEEASFELYAGNDLDVRRWVERNGEQVYPGMPQHYTDMVIGDRQAVRAMPPQELSTPTWYVVPVGDEMLVVQGVFIPQVIEQLDFAQPASSLLRAGDVATIKSDTNWNLWTSPYGQQRVTERPLVTSGSFVTILAIQRRAVQVRTSDGVTGWIRAAASRALTTTISRNPHDQFSKGMPKVVLPNGVPLRAAPSSSATVVIKKLTAEDKLFYFGTRGDWAYVLKFPENTLGWVRWTYDGAIYVAP